MADFNLPGGESAQLFLFDQFGTLNTKANRPAIKDDEFSYLMNWMPIGPGNLRTMWAEGSTLYTAGATVIYKYPFNIGATNYIAVFLSNGTAYQVTNPGGVATAISSTVNTFYSGSATDLPCAAQYQSKYLIIAATTGTNAYFIWDGTNLFKAGTLSPDITITNSGQNYTSAPTVTAYGGTGSGATFTATVTNGAVTKIVCTNPGTGYLVTDIVQLAFTGGGSDTTAQAYGSIATTGGVGDIQITNQGTGHTTASGITLTGGGGTGAQAVITGLSGGNITQVSVTNPGSGYTSAPAVASTGAGSGFTAVADLRRGQLSSITVSAGGSGYTSAPQVVISPPDSPAFPVIQATASAVVSGGAVTGITVTNGGLGYTKPPTITLVGGNLAASATCNLMPFGEAGSSVETINGSVWIANGTNIVGSAPGSTSNFATSAGGVLLQQTNSFLRKKVVALKQTAGILYAFNDSSVDAISNIQTTPNSTTGNATTTFNNSNVDSQIGVAWRDTVVPFSRGLIFANSSGVYALYGGAVEKVSDALDGLFTNATFNTGAGGGVTPTAAVATIFGIRCYMLCFTTIDPFTSLQATMLALWTGQKWFLASPIQTPSIISTQEVDSDLNAWATDGTHVYPLFQTPSASLTKIFQTKLRGDPSPIIEKQVQSVYITAQDIVGTSNALTLSIDTERGSGIPTTVPVSGQLNFYNNLGALLTFTGSSPITFTTLGFIDTAYDANAYGRYLGSTCQTTSTDLVLYKLAYLFSEYSPYAP